MTNYPVGDFLIRIKNAALARRKEVAFPKTKLVLKVAEALKKEGFLNEVKIDKSQIMVKLAYQKKEPIILDVKLVSKPGLRIYKGASELAKIRKPATFFVSTPKGIMTARSAAKARLGGELIVQVW